MCDNTSVLVTHQKCPCAAGGGTTADTLPERMADTLPERTADTCLKRTAGTCLRRTAGTYLRKTADTLPERTAGACPERTAPGRQDTFTFLISANIQIYLHTRGDHLFRTEGEKMNLNVAYYLDEKVFLFVFVCFLFLLR